MGGNWLTFPMASNKLETTVYTTAIPTATATPVIAPRFECESEKGIASTAMTRAMNGIPKGCLTGHVLNRRIDNSRCWSAARKSTCVQDLDKSARVCL